MIDLAAAQQELLEACGRLDPAPLRLDEALGCVTSEDVFSAHAVPPFACSSLDGYAVRAADLAGAEPDHPVALTVLGSVPAGALAPSPVVAGHAWKIMTGAAVPTGADAVVMVEHTSAHRGDAAASPGDTVQVTAAPPAGTGIRSAGSNIALGARVLTSGTVLRPAHLGVLASIGMDAVRVFPRPRVGLLVTGDELVDAGSDLRPGQIFDSNSVLLTALLREADCDPVPLGRAGDDADALAARLSAAAATVDAIVTTGGVSMGDADPVKAALALLGRLHWLQVRIRPAKPFAYAVLPSTGRGVPLFGLPGNPVSALVSFELLARPALRAMAGHAVLHRPQVRAIADSALTAPGSDGRTAYVRVMSAFGPDGRLHVTPVDAQDSHQLAQTARADGLAELAPGVTVGRGGEVTVHSLVWD